MASLVSSRGTLERTRITSRKEHFEHGYDSASKIGMEDVAHDPDDQMLPHVHLLPLDRSNGCSVLVRNDPERSCTKTSSGIRIEDLRTSQPVRWRAVIRSTVTPMLYRLLDFSRG